MSPDIRRHFGQASQDQVRELLGALEEVSNREHSGGKRRFGSFPQEGRGHIEVGITTSLGRRVHSRDAVANVNIRRVDGAIDGQYVVLPTGQGGYELKAQTGFEGQERRHVDVPPAKADQLIEKIKGLK